MNPKEKVEPEDLDDTAPRRGRGDVVRVTIVMPPTMYDAVREGADEEKQLVGEYVRDLLRDAIDREDNWIACPDEDCSFPVYRHYSYCPNCGEEMPEQDEESDEDEESD